MRRFALPAVVIALACVPAADACFLKFFCCKSAEPACAPGPALGPGQVVAPVPDQGPGGAGITMIPTTLGRPVIVSIAGQTPVGGHIPNPVDSATAVTIIVHTPFDPGGSSDLTIEDLGPVTAPPPAKGKDKDKDEDMQKAGTKKHYRPKHVVKKERPKAAPAPAAPGAPVPMMAGTGTAYWEAEYEIPAGDLKKGHRYRATATANMQSSDPVTFETRP